MKTLKFKTNINCNGCLSKVTPVLNCTEGIENWNVDLENEAKILSVDVSATTSENIINELKKIGFVAEEL